MPRLASGASESASLLHASGERSSATGARRGLATTHLSTRRYGYTHVGQILEVDSIQPGPVLSGAEVDGSMAHAHNLEVRLECARRQCACGGGGRQRATEQCACGSNVKRGLDTAPAARLGVGQSRFCCAYFACPSQLYMYLVSKFGLDETPRNFFLMNKSE